jgi:hypothetical protein
MKQPANNLKMTQESRVTPLLRLSLIPGSTPKWPQRESSQELSTSGRNSRYASLVAHPTLPEPQPAQNGGEPSAPSSGTQIGITAPAARSHSDAGDPTSPASSVSASQVAPDVFQPALQPGTQGSVAVPAVPLPQPDTSVLPNTAGAFGTPGLDSILTAQLTEAAADATVTNWTLLAQSAIHDTNSATLLLNFARQGQIPTSAWADISATLVSESVEEGMVVLLTPARLDALPESELDARVDLLEQLLAATTDKVGKQSLLAAVAWLHVTYQASVASPDQAHQAHFSLAQNAS